MGRRDAKNVLKRHGERLEALDDALYAGRYHQALETLRRILGDKCLPSETRLVVSLKEVEALLGLGRTTEAFLRAEQAVSFMERQKLWRFRELVQEVVGRVRAHRGA